MIASACCFPPPVRPITHSYHDVLSRAARFRCRDPPAASMHRLLKHAAHPARPLTARLCFHFDNDDGYLLIMGAFLGQTRLLAAQAPTLLQLAPSPTPQAKMAIPCPATGLVVVVRMGTPVCRREGPRSGRHGRFNYDPSLVAGASDCELVSGRLFSQPGKAGQGGGSESGVSSLHTRTEASRSQQFRHLKRRGAGWQRLAQGRSSWELEGVRRGRRTRGSLSGGVARPVTRGTSRQDWGSRQRRPRASRSSAGRSVPARCARCVVFAGSTCGSGREREWVGVWMWKIWLCVPSGRTGVGPRGPLIGAWPMR
ncbi:uncharacterized protein EI97DRAFT_485133 [Westerdykella ornata]|uniref:Uncharacterized protein n=1 Tax=Westerdykella ornata TaxID=318751 RepID=A0A6A6J7M1_WESOR|nr:uncharacterized protein EI97DRAFT_485133 [Westerdykella ornata]KAF2272217.1 hypothetical protein EI97DRAFT_485133 [Westerdykella ornata]